MDYSKFRRSTNVEDVRREGWERTLLPDANELMDWDDLKLAAQHPLTPLHELKKKPPLPSPILPAPQGSMEDQAGINALPDPIDVSPTWQPDEGRGRKGDREDRVPQRFSLKGDGAATAAKSSMPPKIVDAITRAAKETGEDPAFALAVAERESGGRPTAHSSRSIYGIYQMRGDLRHQYGAGDSSDPYEQAKGWTRFIGDTRQDMTRRLGREPTAGELYLAHHFGNDRAAAMLNGRIPGSMPTSDVFSPYEMSINPHFGRAGTVGNLTGSITGDIEDRMARYGGATGHGLEFSSWGRPAGEPINFSQFGDPVDLKGNNSTQMAPNAGQIAPEVSPKPTQADSAFDRNQAWMKPGASNFNTDLADQEPQFRQWAKDNKVPFDPEASGPQDYDMRGFWKGLQSGDPNAKSAIDPNDKRLHYPDYWKTPYHETFSNESQWADPAKAPGWNDKDQLVTPDGQILFDDRAQRTPAPNMGSPSGKSGGVDPMSSFSPSNEGAKMNTYRPGTEIDLSKIDVPSMWPGYGAPAIGA